MKKFSIQILTLCLFLSTSVEASDGYFMLGISPISRGIGGTGVAYYKTSIIGNNPAGNVFLGKQYCIASDFFVLDRKYNVSGSPSGAPGTMPLVEGSITSDTKLIFVPSVGANWQINDKSTFGLYLNGSGLNTNYPTNTFYDTNTNTTGINILQVFANPTYSIKFSDKHSFGATGIIAFQQFKAEGLTAFSSNSSASTKLTNNKNDRAFGAGIKIGYMGQILNGLHLGATYQSTIYMGKFKEYAGLFAEAGKFNVPSNWTIGLNYEIHDKMRILADVQQIYFSQVKSVGNSASKLFQEGQLLGTNDGPGFGWKDMTIYKFGTEYVANDNWTFRTGYAYGKQPIPNSEVLFNILAPAVNEQHITFGFSKAFGTEGKAIDFAFVHALNNSISGPNPLDPAQKIELSMKQFEFEVSITF